MRNKFISIVSVIALMLTMVGCANKPGASFITKNSEMKLTVPDYSKYMTLGEYKGLEYEYPQAYVYTDENIENDIQLELETSLASFASFQEVTDRPAEILDTVRLSYKGTINGKPFENSDSPEKGIEIVLGYEQYPAEFENAIVGMKKGDTKEITIQINNPDDKSTETSENTAAKNATTDTVLGTSDVNDADTTETEEAETVSEDSAAGVATDTDTAETMTSDTVSGGVAPTEDDPLVLSLDTTKDKVEAVYTVTLEGIYRYKIADDIDPAALKDAIGYESIDEYKNILRDEIKEEYQTASDNFRVNQIITQVVSNSTYNSMPQEEIDALVEQSVDIVTKNAESNQMALDDYLNQYYSMESLDALKETLNNNATEYMRVKMAMCSIARAEKITITEDDIKAYEQELRDYYHLDADADVHGYESEEDILFECIVKKTQSILLDNNTEVIVNTSTEIDNSTH